MPRPTALKIGPEDRDAIRARYREALAAGTGYGWIRRAAAEHGVSPGTIGNILHARTGADEGAEPVRRSDHVPVEALASADFEVRLPRILIFDIETSPSLGYVWGHYEQNVLAYEQEWHLMAFCARWHGTGETVSRILPDYPGYDPARRDDRLMCEELHRLFTEADVLVAHNGDSFDVKKTNARLIVNGLAPPAPSKTVDTKKVARRYFRFNSNKLDDLGQVLGVGRKVAHTGFKLWLDCLKGDREAWELMRRYNEQDVLLLEAVYERLRPWMASHPNMAVLSQVENGCPVCGAPDLLAKGWSATRTGRRQRFQCAPCGAWSVGRHAKVTDVM